MTLYQPSVRFPLVHPPGHNHHHHHHLFSIVMVPFYAERQLVSAVLNTPSAPSPPPHLPPCRAARYAQLSLPEVLSSGRDLTQTRLPLHSASGQPAGHVSVSLQAVQALRAAAAAAPQAE